MGSSSFAANYSAWTRWERLPLESPMRLAWTQGSVVHMIGKVFERFYSSEVSLSV